MKVRELKKVPKHKIGRVDTNGVHLEVHEYDTIYCLASFGFDVEVIVPTNTPKTHNADYLINGSLWEAKSPIGGSTSCISRQFHKASKQADKMILDLRRIKMGAVKSRCEAISRFEKAKGIKRLIMITKDGRMLDLVK